MSQTTPPGSSLDPRQLARSAAHGAAMQSAAVVVSRVVLLATTAVLASRVLEDVRPAGVRIVHNLPAPTTPLPTYAGDTGGGGWLPTTGADIALWVGLAVLLIAGGVILVGIRRRQQH